MSSNGGGLLSHVSQMLTVQTGRSPAAIGGMTAHLLTEALPVHQIIILFVFLLF